MWNLFYIIKNKRLISHFIKDTINSLIVVNLIINKSLYEVLPLILPLYISQCLVIVPHMHTQVSLVLLREVDKRFGVHDVSQQVEALTYLFCVVYVGWLIARLAIDAAMDRTRVDLFKVHNLLGGRRHYSLLVRIVYICYISIDVFLGLTSLQNQVFITIWDFSNV